MLMIAPLPTDLLNLCASYLSAEEARNLRQFYGQFQEIIRSDYSSAFESLKKRVLDHPREEHFALWKRIYSILSSEGSIWNAVTSPINLEKSSIALQGGRWVVPNAPCEKVRTISVSSYMASNISEMFLIMSITSLACLVDDRLICGSKDGKVRILSTKKSAESVLFTTLLGSVDSLTLLSDGCVASGSNRGELQIKSEDSSKSPTLFKFKAPVKCAAELSDSRLAVFTQSKKANEEFLELPKLWCVDRVNMLINLCNLPEGARPIIVALPDSRIAYPTWNNTIHVVSLKSIRTDVQFENQDIPKPIVLSGHPEEVNHMVLLNDGRIVSSSTDFSVRIWPLDYSSKPIVLQENRDFIRMLRSKTAWLTSLIVLEDGRIIIPSNNGAIIWSVSAEVAFQKAVDVRR